MKWILEENVAGGTVWPDEMEERVGTPLGKQRPTFGSLGLGKEIAGLAGSSAPSQDTWAWTCLRTSASLGTARSLIPMVSLAEVT